MNVPSSRPITVGLFGCGNIGTILAKKHQDVQIVAVYDQYHERMTKIADIIDVGIHDDFSSFIEEDFDLLVEAASVDGVRDHAVEALSAGKDLLILSVGALADPEFSIRLKETASQHHKTIHIPSGALFGLDNMKIGHVSEIEELVLRTTKPAHALGMDVVEKRCIFRGGPEECIEKFPKNINVAVALSLAAGQPASVEIWVDPNATKNTHEVFVKGEFGEAMIRVDNLPCPDNPRTSYLAALSIIALLKNLSSPLKIGG